MTPVVRRLVGLLFLGVIGGLVGLTVLLYQKTFTPRIDVTLQAGRIGNQLAPPADVKLRGLVVGSVREVVSTGDGATIMLALDPEQIDLIPGNVRAQLLPKTLFGEKFVNLVVPEAPASEPLAQGSVIPQDRSDTALETERVLDDLMPLLQALRPQQLATTLNAVSGALRGRGDAIGENLVAVDRYFAQLNPEMPLIQDDIRRLAALAETYDVAAPDLLGLLDELSAVNRNLVDQESELAAFLAATSVSTDELDRFVTTNERRLVRLAADSRPSLELLARYSSIFPCVATGLVNYEPTLDNTFGGLQPGLHITLETTQDNDVYRPGDEPAYRDGRAATCDGLPSPPVPQDDDEFRDGYRDSERAAVDRQPDGSGGKDVNPVRARSSSIDPLTDPALFLAGGARADDPAAQRALLDVLAAPALGVRADQVPDLVDLLFGPLARGTTVRVS